MTDSTAVTHPITRSTPRSSAPGPWWEQARAVAGPRPGLAQQALRRRPVRIHALRHQFATNQFNAGAREVDLTSATRHKKGSRVAVQTYVHVGADAAQADGRPDRSRLPTSPDRKRKDASLDRASYQTQGLGMAVRALDAIVDRDARAAAGKPQSTAACRSCYDLGYIVPLVATLLFDRAAFYCVECGDRLGWLDPLPVEPSPELDDRLAGLVAEFDQLADGLLPDHRLVDADPLEVKASRAARQRLVERARLASRIGP